MGGVPSGEVRASALDVRMDGSTVSIRVSPVSASSCLGNFLRFYGFRSELPGYFCTSFVCQLRVTGMLSLNFGVRKGLLVTWRVMLLVYIRDLFPHFLTRHLVYLFRPPGPPSQVQVSQVDYRPPVPSQVTSSPRLALTPSTLEAFHHLPGQCLAATWHSRSLSIRTIDRIQDYWLGASQILLVKCTGLSVGYQ